MTRDSLQQRVITEVAAHSNVLLSWCTGLGKSLAAIKAQESLEDKCTLIVVPEQLMIQNWLDEYHKHKKDSLLEHTEIICYASLEKYVAKHGGSVNIGLVIYDEGHHITELKSQSIINIHAKKSLILSASMHQEAINLISGCVGDFYTDRVTLLQAIKWKLLPDISVVLLPLTLNNTENTEIIEMRRGQGPVKKYIECDWNHKESYIYTKYTQGTMIKIKCTEYQKYLHLDNQVGYYGSRKAWASMNPEIREKALFRARLERKSYVAALKTSYLVMLLNKLKDSRNICFCHSITQASCIGENNLIHSKLKDPQKILDSFKSGEINTLVAVNMLQEGANLPKLDNVIITQLDLKERGFIQKAGRATRNPDDPTVYLLYYKGTFDEEYVMNSLEGNVSKESIKELVWGT